MRMLSHCPEIQRKEGEEGSWVWRDRSGGSFTNLQAPVPASPSAIPAAEEQQDPQDHGQDANPCDPGPGDRQIHLGTGALLHSEIQCSSLFTGTLPAQHSTTQSPRNLLPHGTPGTRQPSAPVSRGSLSGMCQQELCNWHGPRTQVPGARGAVPPTLMQTTY